MPAKISSAAIIGLSGAIVEVEVDVLRASLHQTTIVGLPDTAIKESRDRVGAAIKNSGFTPVHHCGRVTINLAPADLPKYGPLYDVPIALGILSATEQCPVSCAGKLFVGELSLDGSVRDVRGALSVVLLAKEQGYTEVYVPLANHAEAAVVDGIVVYGVTHLRQLVDHLTGAVPMAPVPHHVFAPTAEEPVLVDMADIRGQAHAKRALEIAAAGGHNVLFSGTPGSGKTLMAKAMPGILPQVTLTESLEITKIYSVAGKLSPTHTLLRTRPFRAPHHSASAASLIGGGTMPRPGEISLAHRGVLFLDEFAEFPRAVLDALRQPLEDRVVTVARSRGHVTFPADVIVVAAMNPCPCGYADDPERTCQCTPMQRIRYAQRVSGPIMDRIDLHITVPRVTAAELESHGAHGDTSATIRARVEAARRRQTERFGGPRTNSTMTPADLATHCVLDAASTALLRSAIASLALSARSYHRLIKLARTIADLAGAEQITSSHIAEAITYRSQIS